MIVSIGEGLVVFGAWYWAASVFGARPRCACLGFGLGVALAVTFWFAPV